jgi:hypothetical protein
VFIQHLNRYFEEREEEEEEERGREVTRMASSSNHAS